MSDETVADLGLQKEEQEYEKIRHRLDIDFGIIPPDPEPPPPKKEKLTFKPPPSPPVHPMQGQLQGLGGLGQAGFLNFSGYGQYGGISWSTATIPGRREFNTNWGYCSSV